MVVKGRYRPRLLEYLAQVYGGMTAWTSRARFVQERQKRRRLWACSDSGVQTGGDSYVCWKDGRRAALVAVGVLAGKLGA
jgi:hypothetical protein